MLQKDRQIVLYNVLINVVNCLLAKDYKLVQHMKYTEIVSKQFTTLIETLYKSIYLSFCNIIQEMSIAVEIKVLLQIIQIGMLQFILLGKKAEKRVKEVNFITDYLKDKSYAFVSTVVLDYPSKVKLPQFCFLWTGN